MNRPIKFRAWNHSRRDWTSFKHCIDSGSFEDSGEMHPFRDVTLMQYTGLKDKHGREIYEGDIVLYQNRKKSPMVVVWEESGAYYRAKQPTNEIGLGFEPYPPKQYFEVIGNIHENPELLESDN